MAKKASDNNWRFERKYALSSEEFLQFERLLMLSDLKVLFPDRSINNCYLDDVRQSAFTESVEGYAEKIKTRIRWYGSLFSEARPILEFKLKQNHSNKKETFKLFNTSFSKTTNWDNYIDDLRSFVLEKYQFKLAENLKPVLLNSYKRSYYANFEKTLRLTVDRDLEFRSPLGHLKNKMPHKIDAYIIEIKYNNKEALTNFSMLKNLGKFSKFTTGVRLVN
ncbi:MAG: VTC domain-containing protein [Bacteroidia bacterium]|nr:VTC domain-containing protein [Bacteroidia bacterium]MBT8278498.1 VTC domain-containing protein [Bacteroidia bacterium]NNK59108.1 VTC domain-containing protein [Flavobacteriaceae bacterium]NNL31660.1 VTC domain-containing protein [Flavobacteriaceae bacterium]